MKIGEILSFLNQWAPPAYQESYDNARLITGNQNDNCSGALISLDCIESVLDEAIQKNCNLVIAHHPIVFSGLKSITGKNYIERTIIKAIKNDIAIFAIHTNLDNMQHGVNAKIAEKIGLTNTSILAPKSDILRKLVTFCPIKEADSVREAMFDAGAGVIGNYDKASFNLEGTGTFRGNESSNPHVGEKGTMHKETECRIEVIYEISKETSILKAMKKSHPYEEVAYDIYVLQNSHQEIGAGMIGSLPEAMESRAFLQHLKDQFNCGLIKHTDLCKPKISKVAVCGGSGSFLLKNAIRAGADIFVTADYKYHQFFDADNQIIIADIGHYESEQFTGELIHAVLREKFPNFASQISEINTNPVNYF